MKKLFTGILALAVVFSLSFTGLAEGHLEDGTYTAYSDGDSHGYLEAQVTIEGGEITNVDLTEYQETGEQKGEGYPHDPWFEAMDKLPGRFEKSNSAEVEVVSGATGTSNSAMQAVNRALKMAEGKTKFDGKFMGVSDKSDRGSIATAWVTVKDGEIAEVKLEEFSEGEPKSEGYKYDKFHEARLVMALRMERNKTTDVDTYSGATGSSGRFIQAAERALEKAGM